MLLDSFDSAIRTFFSQLTSVLGFMGYLFVFLGLELLFVFLFLIKSAFSYERRLRKSLNRLNRWLFENKKIDESNIVAFNKLLKRGPKRLKYYWQQYILYREDVPSKYLSEAGVIEKPLKTSSFKSNIKNLGILTAVCAAVSAVFGIVSQPTSTTSITQAIAVGLVIPAGVAVLGTAAILVLRSSRVANLDELYHSYHMFARFIDNACADLNPYIDFDLLFTPKEIEKGNAQLRAYYEARTRKAKEEFEKANSPEEQFENYKFEDVGVDGSLLLNRALKESEAYINKKTKTLSQIAQVETQKDALRRNYENVQMDLQRKIQASKENIKKLIEQQAATTSRMEVGLLRQQQEKEVAKQDSLQKDYDQEESRYNIAKAELDKEIEELTVLLNEGMEQVTSSMASEYQSFYEKIMKNAYKVAEKKVADEKSSLNGELEKNEDVIANIQTQIKRLKDENDYLRSLLDEKNIDLAQTETPEGHYDDQGNYIYADGSYHDTQGLFHDVDGKIYNMNGELVSVEETEEEKAEKERQAIKQAQIDQFGSFVSTTEEPVAKVETKEPIAEEPAFEEKAEETAEPKKKPGRPRKEVKEPTEPKRKPGRPRKEIAEETAEPKKKPGRPRKEVKEELTEPKKKPGRPRKEAKAESESEPKKKPGRPRKEAKEEEAAKPKKKPGRPKKEVKEEPKKRKTRGRPRKVVGKAKTEEPKRGPGRPKKENDVEKLNQLISEEEKKLDALQQQVNSDIAQAENGDNIDKQREEIFVAIQDLKSKASKSATQEELAEINARLEQLINKLSNLN